MHGGVRIVHRHTLLGKHFRGGRLSHAVRTGETKDKHALTVDEIVLPQKGKQRQKWQTKNCKKITVNTFKQMNTNTFELITADACGGGLSCHLEIVTKEPIGEITHHKSSCVDTTKHDFIVANQSKCRMKLMCTATQSAQLFGSLQAVCGFTETLGTTCKSLIGSQDKPPPQRGAYCSSFCVCQ